MLSYLLCPSFSVLLRILNIVFQSESLDFLNELAPSLQDFIPFFLTRVDRSSFQRRPQPVSALHFVLEELCHIKCALNDLLGLLLVESLAILVRLIEAYLIIWLNIKAMKLIF